MLSMAATQHHINGIAQPSRNSLAIIPVTHSPNYRQQSINTWHETKKLIRGTRLGQFKTPSGRTPCQRRGYPPDPRTFSIWPTFFLRKVGGGGGVFFRLGINELWRLEDNSLITPENMSIRSSVYFRTFGAWLRPTKKPQNGNFGVIFMSIIINHHL
jgi:hypothetical protein